MIRTKMTLLGLASVATLGLSVALAGGPACAPDTQISGIYVGADIGAVYNATMKNAFNIDPGFTADNSPWAWTAAGLVGYQFDNNWSVQFGYIWNQDQKISHNAERFKYKNYQLYLALKGTIGLSDALNAYMMVGPVYTNTKLIVSETDRKKVSFYSPMGAVGLSYTVDQNVFVNLQYMFIMNKPSEHPYYDYAEYLDRFRANTQRITLGVNYLFGIKNTSSNHSCLPKEQVAGFYVGADIGAVYNLTMKDFNIVAPGTVDHSPWGWTASGLVGYQFDNHWSAQFGYIWNQDQKLSDFYWFKYKNYQLYLALKGTIAVSDQLSAYMMIGPAYTNTKWISNGIDGTKDSFFSPMGAIGLSYALDQNVLVNLQYMFIMKQPGAYSLNEWGTPLTSNKSTQRLTLGVSFLFAA